MKTLLGGSVETVLLIGAHSDDIEIGCGATVRRLLAMNPDLRIHWIVLSGLEERAEEARRAAARFLEEAREPRVDVEAFVDTLFPYASAMDLKAYFRTLSAAVRPDLIFTHRREDMHQDHRFVAELTWQSFRDHTILEYEIPKYEGDLGRPNVFVPLDERQAEAKIAALMASFASQRGKGWYDAETFRGLMRLRGVECQAPGRYAEAFHCAKMMLI